MAIEVIEVSQDILDEVDKEMAEKRNTAKKQGKHLTKQEMILLYNVLNNVYDIFDTNLFGCSKKEYNDIIMRLDALTE